MILFVEVNAFRNISIYKVLKMFFIGGCASLTLTLLLYEFVDVEELDFTTAITIGVVEEIGKGAIIYYFLKQLNHKYILCGMLIGATVGAGFSALESAGYVMTSGATEGWDDLLATMFVRGVTAPAGHETWSAIVGAALAIGAKANGNQLLMNVVTNKAFLRLAVLPIVLHGLWDSPLNQSLFTVVGLTILVWVIVLILVNMGLAEVGELELNENNLDLQSDT
ncbi:MAG: PrsW family intramembrane metalloprotease [Muribaculaceae bacterium]|nr:PrsW family intramembrane metalloprotease [Muribaculaceae bacterium]